MRIPILSICLVTAFSVGVLSCRQTKPTATSNPGSAVAQEAGSHGASFDDSHVGGAIPGGEGHAAGSEAKGFHCTKDSPPLVMFHQERGVLQYCNAGTWSEVPSHAVLSGKLPKRPERNAHSGTHGTSTAKPGSLAYYHDGADTKAQTPGGSKGKARSRSGASYESANNGSFYCRPSAKNDGTFHCMRSPTASR